MYQILGVQQSMVRGTGLLCTSFLITKAYFQLLEISQETTSVGEVATPSNSWRRCVRTKQKLQQSLWLLVKKVAVARMREKANENTHEKGCLIWKTLKKTPLST